MIYEIYELIDIIINVYQESEDWRELSKQEMKENMHTINERCLKILSQSCSARISGGSAICSRPMGHSGLHRQKQIEWEGPMI